MVVNAGFDSMGGVVDGGVEISSAPSAQQPSYLEKTQAELRETSTAAEKFRRELEFLQKGGDPLDLQVGNGTSVSLQSTSLFDLHPEQFGTSEVKGSFAITASPHGDSVESSGRLGAPSVGEANSADNLMLFDRENKFHEVEKRSLHLHMKNTASDVALDFPKKSYKRRNRSRSNWDGARSSSTDAGPRSHQLFSSRHASKDTKKVEHGDDNQERNVKLNGNQTQKSTQPLTSDIRETLGHVQPDTVTKGFESKSLGSRSIQSLDDKTKDESVAIMKNVDSNGTMELNLALHEAPSIEGNDVNTLNNDKVLNTANDTSNRCSTSHNDNGSTLKEHEDSKGSESALQHVSKMLTKEQEDSILEEARVIEEKRKRIAGLPVRILSSANYHKSHWHFVLEEMSWLANDFAQERLWKATAAAQISKGAAYNSRVRFQQQTSIWKQKQVAHTLAEAVMEFWHTLQVKCHELEFEGPKKDTKLGLHQYGLRFLEYDSSRAQYNSAQAPMTPDRISDLGTIGNSWEDNLTEENLFYTVPPGAIEDYRKFIESHLLQCERTDSSMQEEANVHGYDAVTATESQDTLEEDEGETNPYYLPEAFGGSRSSRPAQKKKKHIRPYGQRSYDTGRGSPFMQSHERVIGPQPSILSGKRPTNSMNVSIPIKRVRTASRPRFSGPTGFIQAPSRPDASSGDNNSFQDEQSSLHGGSHISNNMEVESVGEYEKQLNLDMTEVSNRPRKKKKIKHPGSMFDQQWQLDSNFQNDQKDHLKRRLDASQFDYNGNSVASQTSNMSNSNKFMKFLVRDRGRKAKSLKTPAGQQGFGSPWSLFEDQALVVLVHDMGANWELVSDAMNSILQLKCICRNSKECKERHKLLMDKNNGDGADSAEDSGSSQPYPSTLPGIPEGSARQLFQRLQGPMEENTLKSHFEKIIMIWQKQHYKKAQKDNRDPKQCQQPHNSHALALSQVCPNNLNGGPVLTPLDLCDAISPSPDFVPVGYQGPHAGGLLGPNHGNVASVVSGSTPASSLSGSSAMDLGSHSASAPLSPSLREGRYGVPRAGSLSIEEQHRIQHLNQMSARNMQQSSLPPGSHSGTSQGIRMLPGGTNMGVMSGMNRSMAMARPAFQGIASPSMLNPGLTPGNMHSGPAPGQGNLVRPREALHMMRPNQNSEHQRPVTAPDGMGSVPSQNNTQTPVQSYPHPMSPQQSPHMPHHLQGQPSHPAYGMRFIKERQLHQQRLLQQQFATSNPVMPHVHSQPQQSQIPVSVSSPQSSTPIQSHASPVNQTHQHPQKRPVPPPHGLAHNPQTGVNITIKQPPRQPPQPFQPPARKHHPQQTVKVMNGFSGGQENGDEQNGQGGAASKQSTHNSSLSQSQQKKHPGQPPTASSKQNPSHASSGGSMISSNHRQPQQPQKVPGQTQATTGQKMIQNRKENASELSTSKLQAKEAAKTSEPFYDSTSGPVSDEVPPQSNNAAGTGGSEHSGSAVNHDDAGVQWQKQSSS